MKKYFFLFAFACISFFITAAQQQQTKLRLTDESVVKDSSGTVYPASLWKPLLSSGDYSLRAENPRNEQTSFLLVRLTEEEKKARLKNMPKPRESNFFTTGKTVSSFKTTDINGNKYNLKELKGKVVVINFWFINCGPCRQEMPELNQLVHDYKDSTDIVFLGIALDSKADLKDFLEKKPFEYSIIDNGRFICERYGVTSYPTHLVLDKEGKVVYHSTGYSLNAVSWLRKSIDESMK